MTRREAQKVLDAAGMKLTCTSARSFQSYGNTANPRDGVSYRLVPYRGSPLWAERVRFDLGRDGSGWKQFRKAEDAWEAAARAALGLPPASSHWSAAMDINRVTIDHEKCALGVGLLAVLRYILKETPKDAALTDDYVLALVIRAEDALARGAFAADPEVRAWRKTTRYDRPRYSRVIGAGKQSTQGQAWQLGPRVTKAGAAWGWQVGRGSRTATETRHGMMRTYRIWKSGHAATQEDALAAAEAAMEEAVLIDIPLPGHDCERCGRAGTLVRRVFTRSTTTPTVASAWICEDEIACAESVLQDEADAVIEAEDQMDG